MALQVWRWDSRCSMPLVKEKKGGYEVFFPMNIWYVRKNNIEVPLRYILGHYRISVGLAVANVLCRRMVLDNDKVDQQLRDQLFNAACDDGRDYCQLERDEVEPIFTEAFDNMKRLFADSRVRKAMDTFADALQQRRTLSHIDVTDILHQLGLM